MNYNNHDKFNDQSKRKTNQQTITKINRKIKNNRIIKTMGNITHTMDHYTRNGYMGDTDP